MNPFDSFYDQMLRRTFLKRSAGGIGMMALASLLGRDLRAAEAVSGSGLHRSASLRAQRPAHHRIHLGAENTASRTRALAVQNVRTLRNAHQRPAPRVAENRR